MIQLGGFFARKNTMLFLTAFLGTTELFLSTLFLCKDIIESPEFRLLNEKD